MTSAERTGSFPFFNFARDHGVPYRHVMLIAQHFDDLYADEEGGVPEHSVHGSLNIAVFKVWAKERVRRQRGRAP